MGKIDIETSNALYLNYNYLNSNTKCVDGVVTLHGNTIAKVEDNGDGVNTLYITLAGWNTQTTKRRLNAILYKKGAFIKTIKGVIYLISRGGVRQPINCVDWYKIGNY